MKSEGSIMKSLWAALAAIPLVAAGPPSSQQAALASAAPYIDRANNEWTHAIVSGDPAALSAPYDEHGIFIGPDGSVSIGKAAVRAMYASRPSTVKVLKASIRSDGRVSPDPDDVYEWGTATMTVRRGNSISQASGRYFTVWHRSGERWVITRNIAF
jgi:ketosteroid isomerase-like protein